MMMNETLLSVKDLNVSYKALHVLFDISIEIREGEVVVVVGRNGAGKTTLFRTVAGFLNQTSGAITFKGQDIGKLPAYEVAVRGLKYIQQDKHVFEDLSVRENLELGSYATKDYEWDRVLDHFPKLKTLMDRKGGNLSGGERQMLLMAQSLLGRPELVLMDEPTSALDVSVQAQMTNMLKQLKRELQISIVFITHDIAVASDVCDSLAVMYAGELVELGSAEQVLEFVMLQSFVMV